MKTPRLAIGGLLLPETFGWTFSEQGGEIVGRPTAGPGVLQMLHVPQQTIPQPVTHEYCLLVMRMVLGLGEPIDYRMKESVCGPYGAATFVRTARSGPWRGEQELIHGWYCRRPPGVIYGLYACRKSEAHTPAYDQAVAACSHIMAAVLFDRVGWGATAEDDPLTRMQLENYDRVEHDQGEAGPG